jgi:probable rRNA maturation factor
MPVEVENRTSERVDERALAALVADVLSREGCAEAEAAVLLVPADSMQALNREHRNVDAVTDVLAFGIDGRDELPAGLPRLLGDVVICPQVARAQALEAGHSPGRELAVLTVHGTLHLLGYDHADDAGEMLARQEELCPDGAEVPWPD